MGDLSVFIGESARTRLCEAFALAHQSIDVECYSLSDPELQQALKSAAARGDVHVRVHVEGRPDRFDHAGRQTAKNAGKTRKSPSSDSEVFKSLHDPLGDRVELIVDDGVDLLHAKTIVIDGTLAMFSTANMTPSGFSSEGEVLVEDREPADVRAISGFMGGRDGETDRVCAGKNAGLRARVEALLDAPGDISIASEDLSDPEIIHKLIARHRAGKADRVLISAADLKSTRYGAWAVAQLARNGIAVRAPAEARIRADGSTRLRWGYMHEKYVDAGDAIYVGSGNLTHDGLDEADEVGVVASARDFGEGAKALRRSFDAAWKSAVLLRADAKRRNA